MARWTVKLGKPRTLPSPFYRTLRDCLLILKGYRWRAYLDEIEDFVDYGLRHGFRIYKCRSCGKPCLRHESVSLKLCSTCVNFAVDHDIKLGDAIYQKFYRRREKEKAERLMNEDV